MEDVHRIRLAAREELHRLRHAFDSVGLSWKDPEVVVWEPDPARYTAELKLEFYEASELVDLLEYSVCTAGTPDCSEEEVRQWVRTDAQDACRRSQR
jgi:hypothetical protein